MSKAINAIDKIDNRFIIKPSLTIKRYGYGVKRDY